MMMKAFWWEFIKMKVKLGVLRISDLIWYRTMGSASCFQIDDHLLKNREKWCFNSGKIHDWHNSWRGVSILVIMAESWRTGSVATFWIIQAFFCLLTMKVILHETVLWILKKSTHFSLIRADADSRHGTEGNQWTDGKVRIRRSLFSSLIRISSEHGIWVLYEFRWKGLWIQNYYQLI